MKNPPLTFHFLYEQFQDYSLQSGENNMSHTRIVKIKKNIPQKGPVTLLRHGK